MLASSPSAHIPQQGARIARLRGKNIIPVTVMRIASNEVVVYKLTGWFDCL